MQESQEIKQHTKTLINLKKNYIFEKTKVDEISNIIKNLNQKKTPGPDKISVKMIKFLPQILINSLTKVCNEILEKRQFPDDYKTGETILIHKINKPKNKPDCCRPITLLNHLIKISVKTIDTRLKKILKKKMY